MNEDYDGLFEALQPAAPGQNLDRNVRSKSDPILKYVFSSRSWPAASHSSEHVRDLSGNHYDAQTNCSIANGALQFTGDCSISTPLTSKGHDFTLSFTMKQTSNTPGSLFTGPDSELRSGNGTSDRLMLISAGNAFPLNYSLPVGQWVDASLIGRGNRTFFAVDGSNKMEFTAKIGINGEYFEWISMDIVAPLQTLGEGWQGQMKGITLLGHA